MGGNYFAYSFCSLLVYLALADLPLHGFGAMSDAVSYHTSRWRCVKCKGYVSFTDRHCNDGVCPCCGNENEDQTGVLCLREVGAWVEIRTGLFFRLKKIWVPKKKSADFEFPTGVKSL